MTTHTFDMKKEFGAMIADGDEGAKFRFLQIEPRLKESGQVIFDFSGVTNMTDSFANACFGVLAATHDPQIIGKLRFVDCSPLIRDFIMAALTNGVARQSHYTH